jgi:phospholipase/lecithinase/hemolysin
MRLRLDVLTLAGLLVVASIAAAEHTTHFSALVVFGDSYCDVGNLHAPVSPYYQGRWSNGPLWVEHVAGFLGVAPLTPSSLGGTDYAWDGAAVTNSSYTPSIPQQVERYLSDHGGTADSDALFIIEGGGNDILHTSFTDPEELGYQIALGLTNSEQRLRDAGARHILISDLLNIGLLPLAAPNATIDSAAATATNKWLDILLEEDQPREDMHLIRLNVFALVDAIGKDPTHFGFTNVTDPCWSGTLCADPDHWFFFDNAHPSEFAQSDFAVAVENALARDSSWERK